MRRSAILWAAALAASLLVSPVPGHGQTQAAPGHFYGAFTRRATVLVNGEPRRWRVKGGVVFTHRGTPQSLQLEEFFLYGRSVSVKLGEQDMPTGVISARMVGRYPVQVGSDGRFFVDVDVSLHYRLIDEIKGFKPSQTSGPERDERDAFTDHLRGRIVGQFRTPLPPVLETGFRAKPTIDVRLDPVSPVQLLPIGIEVTVRPALRVPYFCACVGRRLCIQPVGVKSSNSDASPTGSALTTLMDHARDLWSRSCISFRVRPFRYVVNSDWKTITEDAQEEDDLRDSTDVDDCVEVFFIAAWNPADAHGGGVTTGGGHASAKIITSDANDNGIDLHHLAHELGHALTLKHPGSGCPNPDCPDRYDGNTGTVMCPSGYLNDNPDVQSRENTDNASNPLTVPIIQLGCPGVDCQDSVDCGPC